MGNGSRLNKRCVREISMIERSIDIWSSTMRNAKQSRLSGRSRSEV